MVKKPQPLNDEGTAILDLLRSWHLGLKGGNKSAATQRLYTLSVRRFADWREQRGLRNGVGTITKEDVQLFMDDLLHRTSPPLKPKSVRGYAECLKLFLTWCVDEEELAANPMERVTLPKVVEQPPVILADVELEKLLATCEGRDFLAKRDKAILSLMIATPIRRGGLAGMKLADLDLERRLVRVRNKGGREYLCPFDRPAASALDRYCRERRRHPHVDSPMLWLCVWGPLSDAGIYRMFKARAKQAGLEGHPHLTRGTWAVGAHKAGLSPQAIKRVAMWRSDKMLEHYIGAAADDLAIEEYEAKLGKGRIKS